jgi:NAD(P)-dependent dehydrogenase (short-subunit alcohol dehydrogenase family)
MTNPDVVVITGASAGVGRATAANFARRGARIGLLARGRSRLEAAKAEVESLGGHAIALPTDVADSAAVEAAADAVEREFGPIDIWVNNAMATVFSPAWEVTPDELRRATEVTYLGAAHGTLAALRRMRPRNHGTIVQVGSALAYRAIPLQAPYCAAKHALRGYTDAVRCELLHEGSKVHLTMVHLPALNTPQFSWGRTRLPNHPQPVPPIFQPEVAADAIVWAAYHRRREVFVGWPTVKAVFGNKLAPRYADRKLAEMGYEAQQTQEPLPPGRPDNLFEPAPGDYGAHGVFDARARARSIQLWISKRRVWIFTGTAAAIAVVLILFA